LRVSLPTERTSIDHKGRVVIPIKMRKALGLKKGDVTEIFLYKNSLIIRKLTAEPIKALCLGCGKTEDDTEMTQRTTDGRYGICKDCSDKGLKFTEVKISK